MIRNTEDNLLVGVIPNNSRTETQIIDIFSEMHTCKCLDWALNLNTDFSRYEQTEPAL